MKILIALLTTLMMIPMAYASGPSGDQEATKVFDYEKAPASSDDDGLGDILHDDSLNFLDPTASGINSNIYSSSFATPREMYEFCATEFGSSTMNSCISTVKGHQFSSNSLEICKLHSDQYEKLSCLEIVKNGILTSAALPVCNESNPELNGCIQNIVGKAFENDALLTCQENGGNHLNSCLEAISGQTFDSNALSVCALNGGIHLVDCLKFIRGFEFEPEVEICQKNQDPNERTICTLAFNRNEELNSAENITVLVQIEAARPISIAMSDTLLSEDMVEFYKTYVSIVITPAISSTSDKIDELYFGWDQDQLRSRRYKHYNKNDYWRTPDPRTAITNLLVDHILKKTYRDVVVYAKTY
ncbi:MAG: hypothetical protein CL677_03075 [Bdellovibrionaceae bacterium]|nr:hypothetical protein [Pseudobdellovibrionaceae bacterium]|tara:strand:+ start:106883 stop:107959 length:1077 start_codon:yes stop_codon:yes gene_type:complete